MTPTISCESWSQEDKNKDKIIISKINNFNCYLRESLKVAPLFFITPVFPFVKISTNFSDRVFGFQPPPITNFRKRHCMNLIA